MRNLTYDTLDVGVINPTMPYQDPYRPIVNWWFSAADANSCKDFNRLLRPAAQQRLEERGTVAIIATHFGKGFVTGGRVDPEARRLLEAMSRRPGWFVPVGTLLDWLRDTGTGGQLPPDEWRRMQWRWLTDLLRRGSVAYAQFKFQAWTQGRRRRPTTAT